MKSVIFSSVLISCIILVTSSDHEKFNVPEDHQVWNEFESRAYLADIEDFPWIVSIGMGDSGGSDFSGALIAPNWILTEAEYLQIVYDYYKYVTVRFGSNDRYESEQTYIISADNFIIHPNRSFTYDNIGLIRLDTDVILGLNVQPIRLPSLSQMDDNFLEVNSTISGWRNDVMQNYLLHWTTVATNENSDCSYNSEKILCADSGEGDLSCGWIYGTSLAVEEDDGEITLIGLSVHICENPIVFTRIAAHLSWISENTGIEIRP